LRAPRGATTNEPRRQLEYVSRRGLNKKDNERDQGTSRPLARAGSGPSKHQCVRRQ
jgi:hypothetical protein